VYLEGLCLSFKRALLSIRLFPFLPLPASCRVAAHQASKATPLLPQDWRGPPALPGTPQPVIGKKGALRRKGDGA